LPAANRTKPNGDPMLVRTLAVWGTSQRPTLAGVLWMAGLLGVLVWLSGLHDRIFLVPPFAVTLTTLLYLPNAASAQPFAVIVGSTTGAAIGTLLSLLLGFGPGVAMLAALASLVVLPLLRAYHPPGIALAMFPPLLHPSWWFAVQAVLPFTLAAVVSAAVMSRLLRSWPLYPAPLRAEIDRTHGNRGDGGSLNLGGDDVRTRAR
jgi:CBS domain-containing membrane protein